MPDRQSNVSTTYFIFLSYECANGPTKELAIMAIAKGTLTQLVI